MSDTTLKEFRGFPILPKELWVLILLECDYNAILQYSRTSKQNYKELKGDEWFWECKSRKDFGGLYISEEPNTPEHWYRKNWRFTYIRLKKTAGIDLVDSVKEGSIDQIQELLKRGAAVNIQNGKGTTALIRASGKGCLEIVQELLIHGSKVNMQGEVGNTALIVASIKGYNKVVECLLEFGADPNLKTDYGITALMVAVGQGHLTVVQSLLKAGAKVDTRSSRGNTALIPACRDGNTEIVRELLEWGADPNWENEYGDTPSDITTCSITSQLLKSYQSKK